MITSSRFACFAVIPDRLETPWRLHPFEEQDRVALAMLFGDDASLSISDADPPSNANSHRPWVLRSRVTFRGPARSASFHLDRSLTSALRPGDTVHIASTTSGGLGVSVLRDDELVVAVGAVSAVPSGEGVQVRVAPDLWEHAMALVGRQDGSNEDPREKYRHEHPVEISVGGARHVFFGRNEIIEGIHVFIKHGFYTRSPSWARRSAGAGEPAEKDECVALARIGCCPRIGANTSAYLLAADGLDIDSERVT